MFLRTNGGYSNKQFNNLFSTSKCHILKGAGVRYKLKFDQEKQEYVKGQIDSCEIETYFENLGVQNVKLPKSFKLSQAINDMSVIELIEPEACAVNREVYVRAKGIKEI